MPGGAEAGWLSRGLSIRAFDRLEGKAGDSAGVVVPYYTIHKIMAGLLDAHHYLGNTQALDVALKMADYFERRLTALSEEQIEGIFRTDRSRNPQNEFGAMSDVLAGLYAITGDRKHLDAARLFNRPWFVGPLAMAKIVWPDCTAIRTSRRRSESRTAPILRAMKLNGRLRKLLEGRYRAAFVRHRRQFIQRMVRRARGGNRPQHSR
jgi:hypothetical protein